MGAIVADREVPPCRSVRGPVSEAVLRTDQGVARAASWLVMAAADGKVSPMSVTCFHRRIPSPSTTETDRRSPVPPTVMP